MIWNRKDVVCSMFAVLIVVPAGSMVRTCCYRKYSGFAGSVWASQSRNGIREFNFNVLKPASPEIVTERKPGRCGTCNHSFLRRSST